MLTLAGFGVDCCTRGREDQEVTEIVPNFFERGGDESEDETCDPLMVDESFVRHLRPDPFVVEAERVDGPGDSCTALQARAIPPTTLRLELPADHRPGQPLLVPTEHGPLRVVPPDGAAPGTSLDFPLKPTPEFEVQVPPGFTPGRTLTFATADGVEICCDVPEGSQPGDIFDVLPPALMVLVPVGAAPGDKVVFCNTSAGEHKWCRAQIPRELKLGMFFAARLPPSAECLGF
eukprot:CAMPEP_0179055854 /NCGR_PEP_ID=MMETSP0796-20121207/23514_1 /TAXON_ID=73915 /ORGANISM="Pyrodinium bahamense, Strain pbaha01" /LENGTH=232 /DNA_ID=CAMNT_0020752517 /DNA_START=33 /DNA_END=731 /DNA_ORIENTATION=-